MIKVSITKRNPLYEFYFSIDALKGTVSQVMIFHRVTYHSIVFSQCFNQCFSFFILKLYIYSDIKKKS